MDLLQIVDEIAEAIAELRDEYGPDVIPWYAEAYAAATLEVVADGPVTDR